MSSSFADQFLKAGLVSQDDIAKADAEQKQRAEQRKTARANKRTEHKKPAARKPKLKKPASTEVANAEVSKVIGASKVSAEKAQAKKAQQAFAENRRIMNVKINELLKDQPIEEPQDESGSNVKFSYVYDGKIRGIYVSASQQKRLAAGELAVTVIKAKTKLIPIALAESLLAIDPQRFIHSVKEEKTDTNDDPYAGFEVPDDITW